MGLGEKIPSGGLPHWDVPSGGCRASTGQDSLRGIFQRPAVGRLVAKDAKGPVAIEDVLDLIVPRVLFSIQSTSFERPIRTRLVILWPFLAIAAFHQVRLPIARRRIKCEQARFE